MALFFCCCSVQSGTNLLFFTVSNSGGGTLNGTASLLNAGSPFTLSNAVYVLPTGQAHQVWVRFTPPSAGAFTNFVVFNGGYDGNSTNRLNSTNLVRGSRPLDAPLNVVLRPSP